MHVIIGGFQKCGTTTLHESLEKTGVFSVGSVKEMHYFDIEARPDKEHYLGKFGPNAAHTLDSTPSYAFFPFALRRIKETLPDAKLVLLTRDPVSRAVSHYHHEVVRGYETRDLIDALAADVEASYDSQHDAVHHSYIKRSCYAPQITNAKEIFGEDSVFVSDLTSLRKTPQEAERLALFLGGIVDGGSIADNIGAYKSNAGWYIRRHGAYPKICSKIGLRGHGFLYSQILLGNVSREKSEIDATTRDRIADMINRCTDRAHSWGPVFC